VRERSSRYRTGLSQGAIDSCLVSALASGEWRRSSVEMGFMMEATAFRETARDDHFASVTVNDGFVINCIWASCIFEQKRSISQEEIGLRALGTSWQH